MLGGLGRRVRRWVRRFTPERREGHRTENGREPTQEVGDLAPGIRTEIGPPFYGSYTEHAILTGNSPAEYVRFLLEINGGRMRQSALVEATGWAPSTISQHLSEMETNNQVVRYQLGREKVAALPGEVPEAVTIPDESKATGDRLEH